MTEQAPDTTGLFSRIQAIATQVESTMRDDLTRALRGNDALLIEVLEYALLSGGKRIRPVLAVICSSLCGRNDKDVYLLATAFEYLHTATLIHDDVIDHAEQRRNRASVQGKYGVAAAILSGDWLHARSMHLIGSLAGQQGLDIFCGATTAMVDGEFLQLRHVADTTVTEEKYLAVILRKTACLISSTCEIGALFGGGTLEQQKALATYGMKIGIAFQIVDDLLDYQGDTKSTGKRIGNDFVEGKLTLPLIHALNNAGHEDKTTLLNCIRGDRTLDDACVTAKRLMEALHSFTFAHTQATRAITEGLTALACFDRKTQQEHLSVLEGLAGYVLTRQK